MKNGKMSRESLKKLIKMIGFEAVAEEMNAPVTLLRQRVGGYLLWTEEYEAKLLRALDNLGVFQEMTAITRKARRVLRGYEGSDER